MAVDRDGQETYATNTVAMMARAARFIDPLFHALLSASISARVEQRLAMKDQLATKAGLPPKPRDRAQRD